MAWNGPDITFQTDKMKKNEAEFGDIYPGMDAESTPDMLQFDLGPSFKPGTAVEVQILLWDASRATWTEKHVLR